MNSGIVPLDRLNKYILNEDLTGAALHGASPAGRKYGKIVGELTTAIENQRGFYLWGRYETNGLWRNIYLGKAGYAKTAHLRARIAEELRDERQFLWAARMTDEQILSESERHYGTKYHTNIRRALLKKGTTHIVWVSAPVLDESHVRDVEADLIEVLNPTANRIRPAPPASLQTVTSQVLSLLKGEVHTHRPKRLRKKVEVNPV